MNVCARSLRPSGQATLILTSRQRCGLYRGRKNEKVHRDALAGRAKLGQVVSTQRHSGFAGDGLCEGVFTRVAFTFFLRPGAHWCGNTVDFAAYVMNPLSTLLGLVWAVWAMVGIF